MLSNKSDQSYLECRSVKMTPFILTNKVEEISRSVFKPGYRLPTITIEDYLKIENTMSIKPSNSTLRYQNDISGNNMVNELDEEQIYRERQWDEFKEAFPRGCGNTIRTS